MVRRLVERARSRFNAGVAEVDDLDALQRTTVGFVVVSNSRVHATQMISRIAGFLEAMGIAVPLERESEVLSLGGAMAPRPLAEGDDSWDEDDDLDAEARHPEIDPDDADEAT